MNKPRTVLSEASGLMSCALGCRKRAQIVTLTKADFDRLWELAKEALHTNEAINGGRES